MKGHANLLFGSSWQCSQDMRELSVEKTYPATEEHTAVARQLPSKPECLVPKLS